MSGSLQTVCFFVVFFVIFYKLFLRYHSKFSFSCRFAFDSSPGPMCLTSKIIMAIATVFVFLCTEFRWEPKCRGEVPGLLPTSVLTGNSQGGIGLFILVAKGLTSRLYFQIKFDLVTSAFSLLELPSTEHRLQTVASLWGKTNSMLVRPVSQSTASSQAHTANTLPLHCGWDWSNTYNEKQSTQREGQEKDEYNRQALRLWVLSLVFFICFFFVLWFSLWASTNWPSFQHSWFNTIVFRSSKHFCCLPKLCG